MTVLQPLEQRRYFSSPHAHSRAAAPPRYDHIVIVVEENKERGDVLFTGRSVRAALDALSDFGRPSAIRLAVLIDRGGRELPIQADYVGLTLPDVPREHRVNVRLAEVDGRDEILVEPRDDD